MATKKSTTVNKGEGSEFYAFLYILGETKLPLVDKDLKNTGGEVNFLKVMRENAIYEFIPDNRIAVFVNGATHYFDCGQAQAEANKVLNLLKSQKKILQNEEVLQSCHFLKTVDFFLF